MIHVEQVKNKASKQLQPLVLLRSFVMMTFIDGFVLKANIFHPDQDCLSQFL